MVLDAGLRDEYPGSLAIVRELDFDVLVPWGASEDGPSFGLVSDKSEIQQRGDAIIDRVLPGGNQ